MKKSLLALAALTAFAGVASAQSSVTLFGIVDLSVNSVKNGTLSQKALASNQLNSNRLGFRGVEDLGGGMRAGFWLEGAMNNDDGTGAATGGGQNWQRRSTVSLMGGFGEVRLGRDYTPSFWNLTVFDPFGTNGLGSALNVTSTLGSGATTLVRANNSVGYFLPALGGVYGQVQVAASEGVAGNKYIGGRLGYAGGPVNVAAAFGKTSKAPGNLGDFKEINFGASYNLGFMSLMGTYDKRDYQPVGAAKRNQKNIMVGATVPFGQSTLKFSYNKASGVGSAQVAGAAPGVAAEFDAKQFAFGYQYDLSKRTAIYATLSSLKNGGTGGLTGTGGRFTVGVGPAMTQGGDSSKGYNLGVRHSF